MSVEVTLTGGAGEYMESATLVSWSAQPGERVAAGQVLAVVETVKAASEIEAPSAGVLLEILVAPGQEVEVGAVLARIGEQGTGEEAPAAAEMGPGPALPLPGIEAQGTVDPPTLARPLSDRIVASPLARRMAALEGVDLALVQGTGPGGRIKSRDVEAAKLARGGQHAIQGERPVVALVHGFGANPLSWSALAGRLGPSRMITPDLPGHGRNKSASADFHDLVADVERQLVRDADGGPVHLVGHSLGGAVAAAIAAGRRFPVASLTLIAPAGLGPDIDGDFIAGYLRAGTEASLQPWLKRLVADPGALPAGLAAAILEEREEQGVLAAQMQLAQAVFPDATQVLDIRPMLRVLDIPVKVIWGCRDRIIPVRHVRGLPAHVAVHLLDAAGHIPQVEDPAMVARLIGELAGR